MIGNSTVLYKFWRTVIEKYLTFFILYNYQEIHLESRAKNIFEFKT